MLCCIQFDDSKNFAEMKCKYVLEEDKSNSGSLKTPREEKAETNLKRKREREKERRINCIK